MITATLIGDEQVLIRFRGMGNSIRERLRAEIERQSIRVTGIVKRDKLSGQVLKNRTGTLRRKINYTVRETPTVITGTVGVKLAYAAAHEYGLDKIETVREHLRRITQAFGRPIEPMQVSVGSHQRHMHIPERSFLRSTLREQAPTIRQALIAAVKGAIA